MRRNRMRSYTIYGENEEDFIKEYEKTKSRLSKIIFPKQEIKESIQEEDEDNLGCKNKPKLSFHLNNCDEDVDSDLDDMNYEEDAFLRNEESNIQIGKNEDKGIDILINFLKTSITTDSKNLNLKENNIIFNKNKNIMSMSGNAIYDLNIRELVENILEDNDN